MCRVRIIKPSDYSNFRLSTFTGDLLTASITLVVIGNYLYECHLVLLSLCLSPTLDLAIGTRVFHAKTSAIHPTFGNGLLTVSTSEHHGILLNSFWIKSTVSSAPL